MTVCVNIAVFVLKLSPFVGGIVNSILTWDWLKCSYKTTKHRTVITFQDTFGIFSNDHLNMDLNRSLHELGTNISNTFSGSSRHREFGCSFFQKGKTQGICQKIDEKYFYTANLLPTRKILKFKK